MSFVLSCQTSVRCIIIVLWCCLFTELLVLTCPSCIAGLSAFLRLGLQASSSRHRLGLGLSLNPSPLLRHAASLSVRARTSLHAAATSAACSLRRRREGGAGIALATAAGGALRSVASRGVASGGQVAV